ncbi:MAG TPA: CaiB/BaiF CoA-transferase family protein [Casimicrobiaceae bacterium]|nr:CaiB/BaiF CoA-transferase family protein [Casimicrobiaceae bacterium]
MIDAPHPPRSRSAPCPQGEEGRGEGPLAGVRVLDLTRLLPGPMCTLYLADLGADVIKIEDVGAGDYARNLGTSPNVRPQRMTAWYRAINRNKRSLAIDLKNAEGREAFLALARTADVIVEGFRPGVVKALGVDYDAVTAVNARIVYCALSGYGQTGPRALQAGHDVNYLGYCGVLAHTGARGGTPVLSNLQIADLLGGAASAAIAVLGALLGAQRNGIGRYIDVAMTDAVLAHEVFALGALEDEGSVAARGEDLLTGGYPCYGVYETSDGRFVAVGALEAKFWQALCDALDRRDLAAQQFARGEQGERVRAALASIFITKTRDEWADRFEDVDCCVTPVLAFDEAIRDPQFAARGMIVRGSDGSRQYAPPFSMTPSAFAITRDAPRLGEHSREVLREAGYDDEAIDRLNDAGSVKTVS